MIDLAELERRYESLDTALESWRQGDFVIGPLGFVIRFDPELPLRPGDQDEATDSDLCDQDVAGLVVLTQTCDVVRKARDRPYVEVGPLVRVKDEAALENVKRKASPHYTYLPGAAPRMLIADLDRVMTVEKSLLAMWTREVGCPTDQDQRDFAKALARKRERFAFPDDFVSLVEVLRARITQKHAKDSPEGLCLRSLREIRITATPSWDAMSVSLMFWFIVVEGALPTADGIRQQCAAWMGHLKPGGRFSSIDYDIVTLDDLSAREYLNSDLLDLDHLSKAV